MLRVCSYFFLFFKGVGVCGLLIAIYSTNKGFRSKFESKWVWNVFKSNFEKKTNGWVVISKLEKNIDGWNIEEN